MFAKECDAEMKVVAFSKPRQADVIEKSLRHCGLWCSASPRAPPAGDLRVHDPDGNRESESASQESRELTFVDEVTLWGRPSDLPRRASGRGQYAPAAESTPDLPPDRMASTFG